jgi:glycosyltransferase involved in cell wall biosynthesis
VQVVHNGVPLLLDHRPAVSRLRALLPGLNGRPIVLSTARLEEQKGLRYLLEAAAELPEPVFVFAGEGSERARLEAQARDLRVADRVVFLGYREDIRDLLADCDQRYGRSDRRW